MSALPYKAGAPTGAPDKKYGPVKPEGGGWGFPQARRLGYRPPAPSLRSLDLIRSYFTSSNSASTTSSSGFLAFSSWPWPAPAPAPAPAPGSPPGPALAYICSASL